MAYVARYEYLVLVELWQSTKLKTEFALIPGSLITQRALIGKVAFNPAVVHPFSFIVKLVFHLFCHHSLGPAPEISAGPGGSQGAAVGEHILQQCLTLFLCTETMFHDLLAHSRL